MKNVWKKNSPEMVELVEGIFANVKCEKKPMFGCPAYFIKGNMFSGLHQDNFFIRLSETDREKIREGSDEITPFEPMSGRIMKEYVVLPEHLINKPAFLNKWLKRSMDHVSALPAKQKKAAKKK